MTVEDRIQQLEQELVRLDTAIAKLESNSAFGDTVIVELSKQRLRIKTELVTIKQENLNPIYKTE